MKQTNIFLSAGHSNTVGKDRGAVGNGYIEGDLTVELRNIVADNLRCYPDKFYIVEDKDDETTGDSTRRFDLLLGRTKDKDIVLDIHFNADVPSANGTECVIRKDYTVQEHKLATMLSKAISEELGTKNRGVKTVDQTARKKLYITDRIDKGEAIVIVVEVCFISNLPDLEKYIPNTAGTGKAISNTTIEFTNSLN